MILRKDVDKLLGLKQNNVDYSPSLMPDVFQVITLRKIVDYSLKLGNKLAFTSEKTPNIYNETPPA